MENVRVLLKKYEYLPFTKPRDPGLQAMPTLGYLDLWKTLGLIKTLYGFDNVKCEQGAFATTNGREELAQCLVSMRKMASVGVQG